MKRTELELSKIVKLELLKKNTKALQASRPIVDTSLGFSVDGGYQDLQNLEGAKALGLTFVVDSNNVNQTITTGDWDTILNAIRINGLNVLQSKWDKEVLIEAAISVAELDLITV